MADQAVALPAPVITPEVLAFARERGVDEYLPAVINLAQRAFPNCVVHVSVDEDAEDTTYQYIALDVEVGSLAAGELLACQRTWSAGLSQVCPCRYAVNFVLGWL